MSRDVIYLCPSCGSSDLLIKPGFRIGLKPVKSNVTIRCQKCGFSVSECDEDKAKEKLDVR